MSNIPSAMTSSVLREVGTIALEERPVPTCGPDEVLIKVAIAGTFRYTNTWPIARALLLAGQVDLDSLVTHEYGIEQVEEALVGKGGLKRIVMLGVRRVEEPTVGGAQ